MSSSRYSQQAEDDADGFAAAVVASAVTVAPHKDEGEGSKMPYSTPSRSVSTARIRRFARHYLEMVIAMSLGMLVFAAVAAGAVQLADSSLAQLKQAAPAAYLFAMGVSMTVPMVAWMRHRGHGWRPTSEMGASMMAPTLAAVALLVAGVVDFGGGMMIEHVAMFPAMLAVMLARWDEYSASHRERSPARPRPAGSSCAGESCGQTT